MKSRLLSLLVCLFVVGSVAFARDLKSGTTGEDVRQWQLFLNTRNFDLPTNGKFGPATARATRLFQKKWKLVVDGTVGKQTMRKAKQLGYDRIISYSSGGANGGTTNEQARATSLTSQQIDLAIVGYLNENLHDFSSLQIVREGKSIRSGDNYLKYLKYRAKNRLGAFVLSEKVFIVNSSAEVIGVQDAS